MKLNPVPELLYLAALSPFFLFMLVPNPVLSVVLALLYACAVTAAYIALKVCVSRLARKLRKSNEAAAKEAAEKGLNVVELSPGEYRTLMKKGSVNSHGANIRKENLFMEEKNNG